MARSYRVKTYTMIALRSEICIMSIGEDLSCKIESLSSFLSSRLSCDYGCSACPIKGSCGRGCPAISYIMSGDLLAEDGECELRKLSTLRMISTFKKSN